MIKYVVSSYFTRLFEGHEQSHYSVLNRFQDALHDFNENAAGPTLMTESEQCVKGEVLCKNGKPIQIEKPKQLISIGTWVNDGDEADLDESDLTDKERRSVI